MHDLFPDEAVEGWLCLIVPAGVEAQEISVTTGRREQVTWRLNRASGIAR
jgi:hypothetical protein